MLPIFDIFGTNYTDVQHYSQSLHETPTFDTFTKISFVFDRGVASCKVGQGVKSEGDMVITGTKGYIYVPAPWWKTDYFEVRFENPANNKRYFYQLEGEGIRYEILSFHHCIEGFYSYDKIKNEVSNSIIRVISLSSYNI